MSETLTVWTHGDKNIDWGMTLRSVSNLKKFEEFAKLLAKHDKKLVTKKALRNCGQRYAMPATAFEQEDRRLNMLIDDSVSSSVCKYENLFRVFFVE